MQVEKMEDNEPNQMKALQMLNMVSQGCMLGLTEQGIEVPVGYAEIWLDRDIMFYCEINGGTTGKQHVLRFDHFDPLSNQVLFYAKDGTLIAGLAPFVVWQAWLKDKFVLHGCERAAKEWRHAKLSFE